MDGLQIKIYNGINETIIHFVQLIGFESLFKIYKWCVGIDDDKIMYNVSQKFNE